MSCLSTGIRETRKLPLPTQRDIDQPDQHWNLDRPDHTKKSSHAYELAGATDLNQ
jgi:hypothetical protein